ncbi:unnamed protein product [Durusdinium trenchii]|uniref:Uncharacterized protein n=1 Tax=Durusdinium trenchii TaxID=1381693 RepID=A0ABP0RN48_9DINO
MAKTEEEELQAQVRSLEQRELAQMRQGAILQCKLEEAELKHKDLAAEVEDRRARVREEQQEQRMRRQQEALARVEKDLQRRLEELRTRELEFEKSLKQEQSKKDSLEDEVQYWRSCGQALLRRAGTLKESVSQHQESRHTDLQVEMKAMDAQAVELRSRVKEVERMVANGRAQEVEMMTKTQGLLHSLSQAEQSLAASQAKVASLQAELQQAEARKPRASLEDVEKGFGEEEIEYWRRKMQEKTAEVQRDCACQSEISEPQELAILGLAGYWLEACSSKGFTFLHKTSWPQSRSLALHLV